MSEQSPRLLRARAQKNESGLYITEILNLAPTSHVSPSDGAVGNIKASLNSLLQEVRTLEERIQNLSISDSGSLNVYPLTGLRQKGDDQMLKSKDLNGGGFTTQSQTDRASNHANFLMQPPIDRKCRKNVANPPIKPQSPVYLQEPVLSRSLLPALQWTNNSCWIDTQLEAIYWSLRPYWNHLLTSVEFWAASQLSFATFAELLRMRHEITQLPFPAFSLQERLCKQRDRLRHSLQVEGIISTETSIESVVSWFSQITLHEASLYPVDNSPVFCSTYINIQYCNGDHRKAPHVKLYPRVFRRCLHDLTTAKLQVYNRKLQDYLQDLVLGLQKGQSQSCWHVREGTPLCHGQGIFCDAWTSIPLVLTFTDVSHDDEKSTQYNESPISWDFLPRLCFVKPSTGRSYFYQLTAAVSHSKKRSHFRTHFQHDEKVYRYDGMLHNGAAAATSATGLEHVLGHEEGDWIPEAVLYSLCGGATDQKEFQASALKRLAQDLSVHMDQEKKAKLTFDKLNFHFEPDAWSEYRNEQSPPDYHEYFKSPWFGELEMWTNGSEQIQYTLFDGVTPEGPIKRSRPKRKK